MLLYCTQKDCGCEIQRTVSHSRSDIESKVELLDESLSKCACISISSYKEVVLPIHHDINKFYHNVLLQHRLIMFHWLKNVTTGTEEFEQALGHHLRVHSRVEPDLLLEGFDLLVLFLDLRMLVVQVSNEFHDSLTFHRYQLVDCACRNTLHQRSLLRTLHTLDSVSTPTIFWAACMCYNDLLVTIYS